MSRAADGIARAFEAGAGELGMHAASWLIVEEVGDGGGDDVVREVRDRLGRSYSVLDAVCGRWLRGERRPEVRADEVVEACADASRVLVVGMEALHLDALADRIDAELGVVSTDEFPVDWERVDANYDGRLRRVSLSEIPSWSGRRSALLAFVYGCEREAAYVPAAWLRVIGSDVRAQFRTLVAWDVLGGPLEVHPLRLFETSLRDFTRVVNP